ncbi:MAG: 3-oxoacyl-ACP synthase, partial [Myxococcales bacterium]|nr:3-oxoacyl-ACP synthase [Myxococcales bacterium]
VLFGDGAGAAVIGPGSGDSGILASSWGADGSLAPCLYQPAGGTQRPATLETVQENLHTVHMQGRHVFRHAVEAMASAALTAMDRARLTADDVDVLIPHQANIRIMEATRQRTGVPAERMFSVVDRYGNMSAATIPIAIHEAKQAGLLKDGSILLTTAFGTGFTWAAHAIRW